MEINTLNDLKKALEPHDLAVVSKRDLENLKKNFYLHQYESYEQCREVQIFHNKRKINNVWPDEKTLDLIAQHV
jgi:hypothetical protein